MSSSLQAFRNEVRAMKPCPFCGSRGELRWEEAGAAIAWVQCTGCGAKSGWARLGHGDDPVSIWNTRTADADVLNLQMDDQQVADWVVKTIQLFGGTTATAYKVAGLFVEGIASHGQRKTNERASKADA